MNNFKDAVHERCPRSIKNYEGLTLTRNLELIKTYYEYDKEKKEGFYKEKKIDKINAHYLHELGCELEEGFTLGDLFKYLDKDLDTWDFIVGNWCPEYVKEGLRDPEETLGDLKNIELYWHFERSMYTPNEEAALSLGYRMEVHGKGLDKDTGCSISFIKANNLAQLPIVVDTALDLHNIEFFDKYKTVLTKLGKQTPTLFQIVYSLIWELSFHGGPKESEKQNKTIMDSYQEAMKSIEIQKDAK